MAESIDWADWLERLNEILDDCRIGHKRLGLTERLDALYHEQHAAEVEHLRERLVAAEAGERAADREVERLRRDLAELPQIKADRARLVGQVKRVRDQHPRMNNNGSWYCGACRDIHGKPVPAPCPTIRELDAAEAGRPPSAPERAIEDTNLPEDGSTP